MFGNSDVSTTITIILAYPLLLNTYKCITSISIIYRNLVIYYILKHQVKVRLKRLAFIGLKKVLYYDIDVC